MPSFLSKIKALASPSLNSRKSKSANDLSYNSQGYVVKEKDLPKLQAAAWKGDMNKVKEYCKPGKLDAPDKEGRTALHLAVAANHKNIVRFLLDQDAKLNVFDKEHKTPLTIAAINGNNEILNMLINANKNKTRSIINENDNKGLNVLHYVVRNEKASILLRILLSSNALDEALNINHEDRDKNTALHIATIRENNEVVKLLIDRGAELDVRNCDGRTPLMLAAIKGLDGIMKILIDNECDKFIRDNENKTAEDYSRNKPNCIDVLRGVNRQSRSFSGTDKKNQNLQLMRSPSFNNEISASEDVRSSRTDKFEKLFAGGGPSIASNIREDDDDEATSRIQNADKDERFLNSNKRRDEKVNSWNDSDVSFEDNPLTRSKQEENIKTYENYDSIFQNQKEEKSEPVSPVVGNVLRTPKTIIKKQDSQMSEDSSWHDDTTLDERKPVKKVNQDDKSFSFINIVDFKTNDSNSNCSWIINVYTSNIANAGTDANVWLQVYGTKGCSDKFILESEEKNKNLFEKGSCDKFVKVFPDFGKPIKIKIGHDNKGSFPGWHLDKVMLQRASTQEKYTFTANRWLAKNELDGKIDIEVNIDENEKHVNTNDDKKSYSSWNSSGDEDSSISIKKPLSPKAKQLNKINEELNETFGSKKSTGSNGDKKKQEDQQNLSIDSPDKMKTSWANQQQHKQASQAPPEISDIDDISEIDHQNASFGVSKAPINHKGPLNTFGKINERGVDVLDEFSNNRPQSAIGELVKNLTPKQSPAFNQISKREDLVDLEDFTDDDDDDDQTSSNNAKGSSKYIIPNALVKPIIATKPHHGLVSNSDEDDNSNNNGGTGTFSVQGTLKPTNQKRTPSPPNQTIGNLAKIFSPKKELSNDDKNNKQSTPTKYPTLSSLVKPNSNMPNTNDESSDTDYENNKSITKQKKQQPTSKTDNDKNSTINFIVNKNIKKDGIYETLSSDDEIEKQVMNNSRQSNTGGGSALADLLSQSITNQNKKPQNLNNQNNDNNNNNQNSLENLISSFSPDKKKWTNFNEIDKKQNENNSPKTKPALSNNEQPKNNTFGNLIVKSNDKKDNDGNFSDVETNSDMKTSKIEELLLSLQPNQTTWSKKTNNNKPDANKQPDASTESKELQNNNNKNNKYNVLDALVGKNITPTITNQDQENQNSLLTKDTESKKINQLIPSILAKNSNNDDDDDDDDDSKEEYLRQKRAEQEKQLELAKKKQKDHAGSLSSDFDEEEEEEEDDDDFDDNNVNINVDPPIEFSKNSGNASTSIATLFTNSLKNANKNNSNEKKINLIDIIDFSTSDSDLFLRNELLSSETNNFKKQFDSNSISGLVNQQLKTKNNEITQLKQQLDESLKQKKKLEDELKQSNDKTKDLEAVLARKERILDEKDKVHLDIGSKNAESEVALKKNTLLIKDLQNELNLLKNEKKNLESRLLILQSNNKVGESSLIQSLNEQNEKLVIEIKALKTQMEELNTDRNVLSEHKEELTSLLDSSEYRINEHKEALEKVIFQYNIEKAVIKEENTKLKNDLNEVNNLKKKLTDECLQIKLEIKENKILIDKLTKEKLDLEKNMVKETQEKENLKKKYDTDINAHKEQQLQLIEKLGFTEAKLISVEKEYKYCKNTLQEKQSQLDELKETISKLRVDLNTNESLLHKEKEEKIRLSAKNESIEERLKQIQEENANLKRQHHDIVETNKFEKIHSISLKELERKKTDSDKEVNLLKQDLNILNQKLYNAELELKNQKTKPSETVSLEQDTKTKTLPKNDENKDVYLEESRKIKMELDQLRNEFHLLLSKYEVPENDQYYPNRENEIRPQDLVLNRLRTNPNHNRVDIPTLITSNPSMRNIPKHYEHYTPNNYNNHYQYHNQNNNNLDPYQTSYEPSRTTIIVPNCEIIVPNSNGLETTPTKLTPRSYQSVYQTPQKAPCDRCFSETQNYIDIVRNEIARTVELQTAKELPLSNLTYKSAIGNNKNIFNPHMITNNNKLENNYDSLRNSIIENTRYTTTNFDLVNSLRSKYFV